MSEMIPGEISHEAMSQILRKPILEHGNVSLGQSWCIIGEEVSAGSHFCVREVHPLDVSGAVGYDAHFHWQLGDQVPPKNMPGGLFQVYRQEAASLRYLGRGHIAVVDTSVHENAIQVELVECNAAVAGALHAAKPDAMDGQQLERLLLASKDWMAIAEQFMFSWLGPMQELELPACSNNAPDEVRRWHRLWAQCESCKHYSFHCWPACWYEDEESGISWFQADCQNGGAFGIRDGAVWLADWTTQGGQHVRCASSLGEFALQFLIHGLVEGADGVFAQSTSYVEDIDMLPMQSWKDFLFTEQIDFVGDKGRIGIRCAAYTALCLTSI